MEIARAGQDPLTARFGDCCRERCAFWHLLRPFATAEIPSFDSPVCAGAGFDPSVRAAVCGVAEFVEAVLVGFLLRFASIRVGKRRDTQVFMK
jgi:hypothetical protein